MEPAARVAEPPTLVQTGNEYSETAITITWTPPAKNIDQSTPPWMENVRAFALGNVQFGDEDVIVQAWTIAPATTEVAQKLTLTHDVGSGRLRISR